MRQTWSPMQMTNMINALLIQYLSNGWIFHHTQKDRLEIGGTISPNFCVAETRLIHCSMVQEI